MIVPDASAMLALLKGEPGGEFVQELLDDADVSAYAHSLNLCEVYYFYLRTTRLQAVATGAINLLRQAGIEERQDIDPNFWQEAGRLRATYPPSLADCFCIALAKRVQGDLITADRAELQRVDAAGECSIQFIR